LVRTRESCLENNQQIFCVRNFLSVCEKSCASIKNPCK
jgi:hypothetical protein